MTRRELIRTTPFIAMAALSACSTATVSSVSATVVSDVNLIGSALQTALPSLQILTGLNTTQASSVIPKVESIIGLAATFTTTVAQNTAQTIVTQINADFAALETALAGLPLPPNVSTVMAAIGVLLPVIDVAIGLAAPAMASPGRMTPDEARVALRAAR